MVSWGTDFECRAESRNASYKGAHHQSNAPLKPMVKERNPKLDFRPFRHRFEFFVITNRFEIR